MCRDGICIDSVCSEYLGIGSTCDTQNLFCNSDLFCGDDNGVAITSGGTGKCMPFRNVGEACTNSNECNCSYNSKIECHRSKCTEMATKYENEKCTASELCRDSMYCVSGLCTENAICTTSKDCGAPDGRGVSCICNAAGSSEGICDAQQGSCIYAHRQMTGCWEKECGLTDQTRLANLYPFDPSGCQSRKCGSYTRAYYDCMGMSLKQAFPDKSLGKMPAYNDATRNHRSLVLNTVTLALIALVILVY